MSNTGTASTDIDLSGAAIGIALKAIPGEARALAPASSAMPPPRIKSPKNGIGLGSSHTGGGGAAGER